MKKTDGVALSISMITSVAIGAVLGFFTSHYAIFIGIGLFIGISVGIAAEHFIKRKKDSI